MKVFLSKHGSKFSNRKYQNSVRGLQSAIFGLRGFTMLEGCYLELLKRTDLGS